MIMQNYAENCYEEKRSTDVQHATEKYKDELNGFRKKSKMRIEPITTVIRRIEHNRVYNASLHPVL